MTRTLIAAVTAAALATAACSPVGVGTGVGAAFGGILTAALGGNAQQIAIGTLIGGAGGLVVSSAVQAQNQPNNVCQAVDQFGRLIYVAPNGQPTTTPTPYPLLINC